MSTNVYKNRLINSASVFYSQGLLREMGQRFIIYFAIIGLCSVRHLPKYNKKPNLDLLSLKYVPLYNERMPKEYKYRLSDFSAAYIVELENRASDFDYNACLELACIEGYTGRFKHIADLTEYLASVDIVSFKEFEKEYGYGKDAVLSAIRYYGCLLPMESRDLYESDGRGMIIPDALRKKNKVAIKRQRQPRKDAVERVALARFIFETQNAPNETEACKRVGTNKNTYNKYFDYPRVIDLVNLMKNSRDKGNYYRRKYIGSKRT